MFFNKGLYSVHKPCGWTSFDVVNWIKHRSVTRKVGHAGTLDPAAEGLLLVAVGREYTRQIEQLASADKEYVFEITFGIVTDTYDREGKIISENKDVAVIKEDLLHVLKRFKGPQQQLPPMYSAVKQNGQKLYQLARKGLEVERKPKQIIVHELELLDFQENRSLLRTVCSKGTYVRTLCYDIGQELGTGAYMSKLTRTRIGKYLLDESCIVPVSGGKK